MKVSVIIPVYNVQDYLARCIDSVVTQTHSNLEILLVDDGSTDLSAKMCDDYARHDRRITVIHKDNGGLSDARNAALDVMTGDYITFVDADDYVHPRFVELLLNAISTTGAPIAIAHWQELNDGDTPRNIHGVDSQPTIFTRDEALKSIFYQQQLNHSACSRIFKASIFNDVRFPKGMLYEDLAVILPIMKQVESVALIQPATYYYMRRTGSITHTVSLRRTHVLDILDNIESQVADTMPHLLPAVRSRHMSACFNMLRIMPTADPQWQATKQRCWEYTKKMRFLCIIDKNVRLKNKIAILLSYLGVNILTAIINQSQEKQLKYLQNEKKI